MQLVTLERRQARVVFWAIAGFLTVAFVLSGNQKDPGLTATAVFLAAVSVWPFYFWLTGHSHGLPVWPVFAAVNGLNSALPIVQDSRTLEQYSGAEVFAGAMTIAGFLVLGTLIWIAMTGKEPRPPRAVLMIEREHSQRYLFFFAVASIVFAVVQALVTLPSGLIPVLRSLSNALTAMGLFTLAFYLGRGMLSRSAQWALGVIGALTMLVGSVGLLLINSLVPLAMLVLGYMLSSNKVPWKVLAASFVAVAVLHSGKYEMRAKYWGEDSPGIHLYALPQFYWEWFVAGLEEGGGFMGTLQTKSEEASPSVFERAGNLHMLLIVQQKSPREVPFLDGLTYGPIPRLLIPRFLDKDKGISHAGNIMLTVNYGLQTIEQTSNTSIFWGIIPESYANYGYAGVLSLAVLLALFYGYVTRLSVGVPMTTLRFVIGLLVMAAATNADTMGVFVTTQFQGILGVTVASLFLMKRRANPFAAGGGGENAEIGKAETLKGKWGRKKHGAWSGEQGARETEVGVSGMPAPGVLTGLIEGAPEGRAQHGARGMEHGVEPSRAKQLAADGGVVRTMPIRMPKRIASWMPRRVRAAVVAQYAAQADGGEEGELVGGLKDEETMSRSGAEPQMAPRQTARGAAEGKLKDGRERPRQVAVPYQNYRRYRG